LGTLGILFHSLGPRGPETEKARLHFSCALITAEW